MKGQTRPGRPQHGIGQGVSDLVQRVRAKIPQQGEPTAAQAGSPFPVVSDRFQDLAGPPQRPGNRAQVLAQAMSRRGGW